MSDTLQQQLAQTFGNRIRVRVCGIALQDDAILLAKHDGMGPDPLWLPPGGGLDFGEKMQSALQREFLEETGLTIEVERLLFIYEVIRPPFHAIEFFFLINISQGDLTTGIDPELVAQQSITDVKWVSFDTVAQWPARQKHDLFQHCHDATSLLNMKGHYQYVQ